MQYIFVGLAGMLGAICRYSIGLAVTNYIISTHFPFETLFINILGCFLLGWLLSSLSTIQDKIHPDIIKSIRIGFIGAFTTFSAFSVETLSLIDEHQFSLAFIYIFCSIVGGMISLLVGLNLFKERKIQS